VLAAGLYVGEGGAAVVVGACVTTVFAAGGLASAFGVEVEWVVCVVTGASGVGVAVVVPAARVVLASGFVAFVGASAIRGDASLRGPAGGSSGVGAWAAQAGPVSAGHRIAAHAATTIPLRRSVRRRDDVLVDTRPSLLR